MAQRLRQSPTAPLDQAAALILDVDALRSGVETVLTEDLYWFPVRHHSPTVARHLRSAILERRPKLIFMEGPHEANDLIPFVVDSRTKPPVAIYSSYRDDDNVLGLAGIESPAEDIPPRFACWYPMLAYSPEYVALQTAKKTGTKVVFMDLPHYAMIKPRPKDAPESPTPLADKPRAGHA